MQDEVNSPEGNDSLNKTFRLRKNVVSRIEADAHRAGISTNALVSNILTKYVEWDRVASDVGFVSLAPNMIKGILDSSGDDMMSRAGKLVSERSCFKDVSLHFFQQYNPSNFMKLAQLFQKYAGTYKLQGERSGADRSDISFYHDFGKKWSEFVGFLFHYELERLKMEHNYEISDNAVVFRFLNNSHKDLADGVESSSLLTNRLKKSSLSR